MFTFAQQFTLSLQLPKGARWIRLVLAGALLLAPAVNAQPTCDAWPVTVGETVRHAGGGVGDSACFLLDVPLESLLAVDALTPVDGARVRLHLQSAAGHRQLRASGDSQLQLAAAGQYRLRVEAEDPRKPLPSFRLLVRALPSVSPASQFIPAPSGAHGELDTELEIDPNLLLSGLDLPSTGTDDGELDTELEIDPNLGELDTELEIDPNLLRVELTSTLTSLLTRLCGQAELDDHGDDVLCATPLTDGVEAHGEIANAYSDDRDVYRFRVEELATVALQVAGQAEFCADLVDAAGQHLDARWSRDAERLRGVVTLVAGSYELRVEGCGGTGGNYRVSLEDQETLGGSAVPAF